MKISSCRQLHKTLFKDQASHTHNQFELFDSLSEVDFKKRVDQANGGIITQRVTQKRVTPSFKENLHKRASSHNNGVRASLSELKETTSNGDSINFELTEIEASHFQQNADRLKLSG